MRVLWLMLPRLGEVGAELLVVVFRRSFAFARVWVRRLKVSVDILRFLSWVMMLRCGEDIVGEVRKVESFG